MVEQFSGPEPSGISPSIYLDYGADEHNCSGQGFEICERGMRFSSRWQFSLGTQLAIAFSYQDASGNIQRATTEGIIVDCDQIACKCFLTTLLFLELPDPLRLVIQKADPRLQASVSDRSVLKSTGSESGLN